MKVIQIMMHKVRLGMTIAEDIYQDSLLLVPHGTLINDEVLNLLRASSIISISVYGKEDDAKNIVEVTLPAGQQTHSEKLRNSAEFIHFDQQFKKSTETFTYELNDIASRTGQINVDSLFDAATELMSGETNTYHLMDILSNIRYFDDSTYAHSLNVAMLANILGNWLHFSEQDLKTLTIAGMLHDIGKVSMPADIIKKPGRLTEKEFSVIKKHPLKGYEILKNRGIDENIAQAALLHHEKCDGSGYPLGIRNNKINELAKLITIVDIYEAMTANRCYREGICPFTVIKMYEDEGYKKYEPKYLIPFLQGISDTYLHNTVLLNDGRRGEIIMTNKSNISRPGVLVDNQFVDLARQPDLDIIAIL